jgi:purine-cytosine permease-like protein
MNELKKYQKWLPYIVIAIILTPALMFVNTTLAVLTFVFKFWKPLVVIGVVAFVYFYVRNRKKKKQKEVEEEKQRQIQQYFQQNPHLQQKPKSGGGFLDALINEWKEMFK